MSASTRWGVVLGVSAACGAAVVVVGVLDSPAAVPFGSVLSGMTAVVGGATVLLRDRRQARREPFRPVIGLAAVIWGLGQVVAGFQVAVGASYPTTGDVVSTLAGPVAIAGVGLSLRRVAEPQAALRFTCEGLVAGGLGAALLWRAAFAGLVDVGTWPGVLSVAILLLESSVVAVLAVAALREDDPGMVTVASGVGLFVAASVFSQYVALSPSGGWSWEARALMCLAWPLVCAGLLRMGGSPSSPDDGSAVERRRTLLFGGVVALLLAALLWSVVMYPRVDGVTLVLLGTSLVAAAVRDVVVALQSTALLARVRTMAYVDVLTGLANRRALVAELTSRSDSRETWLLTLDLDNFKNVNGQLGHSTGDQLLARMGRQLEEVCREGQQVFRLGGDEFAVLATGDRPMVEHLAERLVLAVRVAALAVPGVGRVALGASVGIAPMTPRGATLSVLAESAVALRAAKEQGRNSWVVYADQVAADSQRRRLIEARLRVAVQNRRVTLHAQPVVRLDTGAVCGVEMLARWTDPELGPVAPAEFIDVAEASSLIVPLGEQLLDLAISTASRHRFHDRDLACAVNVSPVQLRVPGFAEDLLDRLRRHRLPPSRFILEVTEQIFVSATDPAGVELQRLATGGVVVAVDDFGAGSAALGYLRRMPGRILKLDRSLVASMLSDRRSAAIVASMAQLGADTGLDVVAEGIEDEATAAACLAVGIPYGQGWHYARDVPLGDLEHVLAALGAGPLAGAPSTVVGSRTSDAT